MLNTMAKRSLIIALALLPRYVTAETADSLRADSAATTTAVTPGGNGLISQTPAAVDFESLGGNLPPVVAPGKKPYLVTADVYVPSGKTVRIEAGTVLLFKNFTGMHVEGRLVAQGTAERPIVYSSEYDRAFNTGSTLHANPYDWNGIYIHEGGLGTTLAHCEIRYSVYGVNALTRYIRFDKCEFSSNGRADLTIEGKPQKIPEGPFSYALTIDDAQKAGVPVQILMDPKAKKRSTLRYGGLGLLAGGVTMAVWCSIQVSHDQQMMAGLKDTHVTDENSNLVKNLSADWEKAAHARNRDVALTMVSLIAAFVGGSGFGFSFTF